KPSIGARLATGSSTEIVGSRNFASLMSPRFSYAGITRIRFKGSHADACLSALLSGSPSYVMLLVGRTISARRPPSMELAAQLVERGREVGVLRSGGERLEDRERRLARFSRAFRIGRR